MRPTVARCRAFNITVTGTTRGAVSDTAGRFTIADVPAGAHNVQARGIGFALVDRRRSTSSPARRRRVNFSLTPAATELNADRRDGLRRAGAAHVTGAISTVQAAQLKDIPTTDPMKALQGHVAGVEIVASSNEPGAAMNVRIRGVRSLTASNEPLYVVDGIPIGGGIQDFNPQMIESIDVLKDAAATAIYGSRGANGVILVTTKKGGATDGIHAQYTRRHVLRQSGAGALIPMMNLQQYVQYMKDARRAERPGHEPRQDLHGEAAARDQEQHLDGLAARRAPRRAAEELPGRPERARTPTRATRLTATTSASAADPRAGLHARRGVRVARSHVGSPARRSHARTRRASITIRAKAAARTATRWR